MDLKQTIRSIPDFPQPGVIFRDITTLMNHAEGFRFAVDEMVKAAREFGAQTVAGIEARGFIVGGAIAHQIGAGFVPIRKQGKLPRETIGEDYELEYGTDRIEMHTDMLNGNERVFLVDDLIATGGTALAAVNLVQRTGATVACASFIVDLPDLGGSQRLRDEGVTIQTLVEYEGH